MQLATTISTRETAGAHGSMLLWAALVGLSFPAVSRLGEGLPPLTLTALRFVVAALVLAPLVARRATQLPGLRESAVYAFLGASLAAFFAAMFWAGERASALSLSTLYVTVPLLTYLLGLAFGVERWTGGRFALLALGAAGALGLNVAASSGPAASPGFGSGEAAFLLGCGATALYPVVTRWGLERGWLTQPAGLRAFWSLLAGALLIGAVGLAVEDTARLAAMTGRDAWLLAYLAAFGSAGTFWLMQRAAAVLRPSTVTAYSYLVPLASLLLLIATQPRQPAWSWLPGGAAVLLAMALLMRQQPDRPDDSPKETPHVHRNTPATDLPDPRDRAVGASCRI